jgi:hypothetical protein
MSMRMRSGMVVERSALRKGRTFVEHGQDGFDIGVHLDRRRLAEGEVALPYIAGARPRDERVGQRLSPDVFVVGAPVNVDDIAHAMFHRLHLCCGDQARLVSGVRGASRTEGRRRQCVRKIGSVAVQRCVVGRRRALRLVVRRAGRK